MVVLVDCDNFFASCERVMQPHLAIRPVAVLSNNDGCVIARSTEVKRAGVTMGQPYHECKALLDSIGAEVVSANFLLYRHFAKRLQGILRAIPTKSIEVYSIDESFLEIDEATITDPYAWAEKLRQTIYDWTGLPVSVGIGSSRALAKLAARIAKSQDNGVYFFDSNRREEVELALRETPIASVWGIGRKLAPKLQICGIHTAYDLVGLTQQSPAMKLFDATTRDLVYQLHGWTKGTGASVVHRKSIMHSRSFGVSITNSSGLRTSLADFCTELAAKLRRKELVADRMIVVLRYRVPDKKRGGAQSIEVPLGRWSNDTFVLCEAADSALNSLYVDDRNYIKAMILLPELRTSQQLRLEESPEMIGRQEDLLSAIDALVTRYGALGPRVASTMLDSSWRGKRQYISPYNHAEWHKLPPVQAA